MNEKFHNDESNKLQFGAFPAMNAGTKSNKVQSDAKFDVPLCLACANGKLELVKELIHKGADLNQKDPTNLTPIMHAALNGHRLIIKFLAENGAKISYALLGMVKSKTDTLEKEALQGKEDPYEVVLWRNLLDFLIQEGKKQ